MKNWLDTGDLVEYESGIWIVVTPRCDLANQGKVATILLASCEDISVKWNELTNANSKVAEEKCKKLIQHEGMPKQHFLLPMRDAAATQRGPWMVQFHNLKVLPVAKAIQDLTPLRFASLSPLFVPSLVERLVLISVVSEHLASLATDQCHTRICSAWCRAVGFPPMTSAEYLAERASFCRCPRERVCA